MSDKINNKPQHRVLADKVIEYLNDGEAALNKNEREYIRRAFAKAVGVGLSNGEAKNFVWKSHNGKTYLVQQMATPHLFYALRMIWNHSIPEYFRIPAVPYYPDVPHWSKKYKKQAMDTIQDELESRDFANELDEEQLREYYYMQLATKACLREYHQFKANRSISCTARA